MEFCISFQWHKVEEKCAFFHVVQPCVEVQLHLYYPTAYYTASYPPKIVDPESNTTEEVELGKLIIAFIQSNM